MAEDDSTAKLFYGVSFTTLPSDEIGDREAEEINQALQDNGATWIPLLPNGDLDEVSRHSHIISSHVNFPQYEEALDNNCHIVKPSWVQQSLVKHRQAQARQHSPDPALIFQSVVVSFGDLPRGDRDAITAGVMAMGGMYSPSMTKLVTHVVSMTEESEKIRVIKTMGLNTKVVLPHWFDDCLKLGKKISEGPYLLPHPPILESVSFSGRDLERGPDLADAKSAVAGLPPRLTPPPSSPGEPATPRKSLNVFKDKNIFFCGDLHVHQQLATTLQDLVRHAGGIWTDDVEACDIFVGHHRDGQEYVTASRAGKIVGNLVWFYSVITRNRWSNPKSKLLHYPVPRDGIPGFEGMRISLSNYTGDARIYLENIINTAGAEFTKTMKQDNTHLVTAHQRSEKCDAAHEWNINIINHLWLEDSYAKCRVQSLTNPRYTHFPTHTNLSEIVGQTQIDADRVEELYWGKKAVSGAGPPNGAHRSPSKTVRGEQSRLGGHGATEDAVPSTNSHTPLPVRYTSAEKENEAPSASRGAKLKASAQLEKAAHDIAEFEKERKRKGGVTHGRKRGSENGNQENDSDDNTTLSRPSKKVKQHAEDDANMPEHVEIKYRMLLTGDDRWLKKPKKEASEQAMLRRLGIQMVTNPSQCNLLCAPKVLRTRKFVTAIAAGPEVVNTKYLDYALKNESLKDTSQYRLSDSDSEKKFGFNLLGALERAKINKARLLRGWTIYITEKIGGGYETFKDIVEANGGTAILYKGRTGVQLPRRRLGPGEDHGAGEESQHQGGEEELDFVYLVSSVSEEEMKLWPTFRKLAEKQELAARVVKTDWLLNLALAQEVRWDEKWELDEEGMLG